MKNKFGFGLIELMVALIIIGIIVSFVLAEKNSFRAEKCENGILYQKYKPDGMWTSSGGIKCTH